MVPTYNLEFFLSDLSMISLRCYCYFWILKFSIESVLEIYVHIISALHLQFTVSNE